MPRPLRRAMRGAPRGARARRRRHTWPPARRRRHACRPRRRHHGAGERLLPRYRALRRCCVHRALAGLPGPGIVWSAGCANGQEAWSLAIALEEAGAADCAGARDGRLWPRALDRAAGRPLYGTGDRGPVAGPGGRLPRAAGRRRVEDRARGCAPRELLSHNLAKEPPTVPGRRVPRGVLAQRAHLPGTGARPRERSARSTRGCPRTDGCSPERRRR